MMAEVTDLTRGVYRRLYGGFITGQRINKLTLNAEAWFWRILATVDDFGNGNADPELCRAATVGRRPKVTTKQVSDWLREMRDVGLLQFYSVKDEPFLHVTGFEATQPAGKNGRRIRRYPSPDDSEGIQENPDAVSASYSDTEDDSDNDTEDEAAPPFASEGFLVALADYEEHRRTVKKSALTAKARKLLYGKLAPWGEHKAIQALNNSVINGWRGVFEPDEEKGNGKTSTRYEPASERNVRNIRGSLEYLNSLSDDGGQDDSQDETRLLAAKSGRAGVSRGGGGVERSARQDDPF